MNRTTAATILIATGIWLALGSAQTGPQAQQPQGLLGRYQLVTAEHTVAVAKGGVSTERDLVRIDTTSGETSSWVYGVDQNGTLFSKWAPIK